MSVDVIRFMNIGRIYCLKLRMKSQIGVVKDSLVELTVFFIYLFLYCATENMKSLGNAFVACGVIYIIDNYGSRSTTINCAYDTKTGRQLNPNIQFTNQFGYNSMVDYNPREKVLYSWDNRRLVTYPITFEEQ